MIIHEPEIISQDGYAILSARMELEAKTAYFPEFLWYRAPERFGSYLSTQSDAFLVAALQAAMFYGEDIYVRGPVSPRLAYHLEEYQFILNFRKPAQLRPVQIEYHQIQAQEAKPARVGATFTGGIDSLYTLWQHLPPNQTDQDYLITDAVFIRGFDILHNEEENYQQLYQKFEEQLTPTGVNLIRLETNMVSFIHTRLKFAYFYGPLITSVGLALQAGLKRYYVPSTWDYYNLSANPHTGDALVDGLLSTDTIDLIHHGSTQQRVAKVRQIASWELAQEVLWVCLEAKFEERTWNCSWCEKCVRTMIPLYALGVLERYKTFEKPFTKNSDGLKWARKFSLRHDFVTEMFPFVKKHKPDLLPWLSLAAFLGNIRYRVVEIMPGFIKSWLRRYGYFVMRNEAPDAYESAQVTQFLRERNDTPRA